MGHDIVSNMNIGKRIVTFRKYAHLSQVEFAQQLGLTQSLISRIESGKTPLTKKNIRHISMTFDIQEEWLKTGKGEMLNHEAILSDYEKRLISLFHRLSPRAQDMLIEYAEKLAADEQALRGNYSIATAAEKGEKYSGEK
jgi:transcriptional regulator with XRE-family HTH domain